MQTSLAIILSIVVALLLSVMPMPEPVSLARPMWLALVLSCWVMALPHRVGLLTAWLAGLLSDVLFGQLFGQNALVMTLVVACSLMSLSGCKKISYDLTKNSELEDSPEYTVGFDQNLSPAEGEVKKAN